MLTLSALTAQSVKDELDEAWRLMVVARYRSNLQRLGWRAQANLPPPGQSSPGSGHDWRRPPVLGDRPDEFSRRPPGLAECARVDGQRSGRMAVHLAPSALPYLDLTGRWEFRTDPDTQGEQLGWPSGRDTNGWCRLVAPKSGRARVSWKATLTAPATRRFIRPTSVLATNPTNGFAWYRKKRAGPRDVGRQEASAVQRPDPRLGPHFPQRQPVGKGEEDPPPIHEVPGNLVRFGQEKFSIAVQVLQPR